MHPQPRTPNGQYATESRPESRATLVAPWPVHRQRAPQSIEFNVAQDGMYLHGPNGTWGDSDQPLTNTEIMGSFDTDFVDGDTVVDTATGESIVVGVDWCRHHAQLIDDGECQDCQRDDHEYHEYRIDRMRRGLPLYD